MLDLDPGQPSIQILRLHLLARHDLLDRRQLQDNAEYRRECAVIPQSLIVKYQMLELAPFDRHDNGPMRGIDRRDHTFFALCKLDARNRTVSYTDAAAKTDLLVELRLFLLLIFRIIARNKTHGFDRTRFHAFSAAGASGFVDDRQNPFDVSSRSDFGNNPAEPFMQFVLCRYDVR